MAEKRSVYLSSRALAMPRRCDSLSGRINQVCDRYSALLMERGPPLRAMFSDDEWSALLDACAAWIDKTDCTNDLRLVDYPPGSGLNGRLSCADRITLAELLEAEL